MLSTHPLRRPQALWLLPLFLAACGGDDAPSPDAGSPDAGAFGDSGVRTRTLAEVATDEGLERLLQAAETAGLTATFSAAGPFTVFAPSNAAFDALGSLPSDPDLLANVLSHHLLPFEADSATVLSSATLRNSAGLRLAVDAAANPPTVGGAALGPVDRLATNGVLHVIDRVLLPPTIPELVATDARVGALADVVAGASAEVPSTLSRAGPITLFAPIDSAFERVDLEALTADPAYFDDVLRYHVAEGQLTKSDLTNGRTITMANGQTVTVRVLPGDEVVLVDAQSRLIRVAEADIRLANGVVHLVEQVLLSPRDAVDLVETLRRNNLNGAATAATDADLAFTLATDGPFTLFAPTDEAFAALGSIPDDPDLLANVILNHGVAGALRTEALSQIPSLTSLAGIPLVFDFDSDPATVNGAGLTRVRDQAATNGVVHAIDRVLVPPLLSAAPRLFPELTTFEGVLGAASDQLRERLAGPEPLTVFAPIDGAFDAVNVDNLLADPGRLDEILQIHVAQGQTLSSDLRDGDSLITLNGVELGVRIDGDGVTLVDDIGAEIGVVTANVRLLNGVMHLIDGVLSPGHVVERARVAGLTALVSAATQAGLSPVLRSGGPFTLFGPTNQAFETLGVDLDRIRPVVVENILLHHVVSGSLRATEVLGSGTLTSIAGIPLVVTSTPGMERIGGARLSSSLDIEASNGILHVVDDVILPPSVLDLARDTPDLSTLVTAVSRASTNVATALDPEVLVPGNEPITVFAPVNSAFASQGIDPTALGADDLDPVLQHHVVVGQLNGAALSGTSRFRTLNQNITITRNLDGSLSVIDASGNVAEVLAEDIRGVNGVVHLIDRVLVPR